MTPQRDGRMLAGEIFVERKTDGEWQEWYFAINPDVGRHGGLRLWMYARFVRDDSRGRSLYRDGKKLDNGLYLSWLFRKGDWDTDEAHDELPPIPADVEAEARQIFAEEFQQTAVSVWRG